MTTQDTIDQAIREAQDQRNREDYIGAKATLTSVAAKTSDPVNLGYIYHTLGTVEQAARNYSRALSYFKGALALRQEAGDTLGAAYTAFQIPMCRKASGEPDDHLIEDFRTAQQVMYAVTDRPDALSAEHMGNMLQNLAFCFQIERDWQKSLEYYREAGLYRRKADDRRGGAMTLARMAECQIEIGEVSGARENAQKALDIFQELGDVNRIRQVEEILRRVAEVCEPNSEEETGP